MAGTTPQPGTTPRRRALLLGCGTFADDSLAELRSPRRDVEELTMVLGEPDTTGYEVTTEIDCTSQQAQRTIEAFLLQARRSDDMHLIYFSCHGVQNAQGKLFFAFSDTEKAYLSSTAVSADWVRDRMTESRSKATVVLVDCCFSGAFIKGMRARSGGQANVGTLVRDLADGKGVAVITASGTTEVSYEDADSDVVRPSYFTQAVLNGIRTGAADLNRDGLITADELYDFVYDEVANGPTRQRPQRFGMGEGMLVVADAPVPAAPSPAASPVLAVGYQPPPSAPLPQTGDFPPPRQGPSMRQAWPWIGRAVLWPATLVALLFEMAALGVTFTDGWGGIGGAVAGNLLFAVPLIGLAWLVIRDVRRLIRRRAGR